MLFMAIECFRGRDAAPIYQGLRDFPPPAAVRRRHVDRTATAAGGRDCDGLCSQRSAAGLRGGSAVPTYRKQKKTKLAEA